MKVHCFFEQSGTFKNAFNAIPGYTAADYDIENTFGETDYVIDLFEEIETAYYTNDPTIFDGITPDDLIFAFFPCIYFCECNQLYFTNQTVNFKGLTPEQRTESIIKRADKRHYFYIVLLHLYAVAIKKNLSLIIENPYSPNHYLFHNFPVEPSIIDYHRNYSGDNFAKPTQYFFVNCRPNHKYKTLSPRRPMIVRNAKKGKSTAGKCNIERSTITPEYATNFIFDYIIGKPQKNKIVEQTLF